MSKPSSSWRSGYYRVNFATMLAFGSLVSAFNPTLSLLAQDLAIAPLTLGVVFSLPRFFGVLLRIPAGMVATIVGHRKILIIGCIFCILGPLFLMRVESFFFMAMATVIYGLSNIYAPAAISLVNEIVPEERKTIYLGYHSTLSGIGRALGPVIAGFMIDFTGGYRSVFAACALAAVVSLVLTMSMPQEELAEVDPSEPSMSVSHQLVHDFKSMASNHAMVFSTAFRGLQSLVVGGITTYFPWYGKSIAGLSASQIGIILGSFVVGSLCSRSAVAGRIKKKGHHRIMTIGTLISGVCLVLSLRVVDFWALFALMTIIGVCEGVCHLAALSYLAQISGERLFGGAMGLLWAMADLGTILGRMIPGVLLPALPIAADYSRVFAWLGGLVILSGSGLSWGCYQVTKKRSG